MRFVYSELGQVSEPTRLLARIFDVRAFAKSSYDFSVEGKEGGLSRSFQHAYGLLPRVTAMLFDGHTELDLTFLTANQRNSNLKALSIANCARQLPTTFYTAPSLQSLIYLDASNLPGSILPLMRTTYLPSLRILKLQGREIDDTSFRHLTDRFRRQLWSLDVENNNITDHVIQNLYDYCIPVSQLRTAAHKQVEGTMMFSAGGSETYGPFSIIDESDLSACFSHPERYFVDAPSYTVQPDTVVPETHRRRTDGSVQVRNDTVNAALQVLLKDDDCSHLEDYQQSAGITHLRLSKTQLSAFGVQKLLRLSGGHIEYLSCECPMALPIDGNYRKAWPPRASLRGMLGSAQWLRPAVSSNLRALRLHHSIVTNIPTLDMDGLSQVSRYFLAETVLRQRADVAWPEMFIPDLNPRLYSLTLTCVPRRSTGPLTARLIQLLKLLSIQERSIQDVTRSITTRHGPKVLKGLRYLRLEFEPDNLVDDDLSRSMELNAEELMASGEKLFSFFDDGRPSTASTKVCSPEDTHRQRPENRRQTAVTDEPSANSEKIWPDFVPHHDAWNGIPSTVQVWVGHASPDQSDVLRCYRQLVLEFGVRDGVGPATAAQIQAGAPQDCLIYHVAWTAAIMPRKMKPPTLVELSGMRDVIDALRTYRANGRAIYLQHMELARTSGCPSQLGGPHYFWTGRLEISTEKLPPRRSGRPGADYR
ncbi:hypothetical protein AAL_02804 [Moelleriella libera RCEF 2490]|uniref:Leucine rich repeat domain containing protein n=1 Tax=Moelleriella libera RCEF 2490 TaxID=1081109 RepID=A0A168E0A5_9HYPO|nr:hypothetical protein AAL_02804 [Moelleriella libera RCEF 2490]